MRACSFPRQASGFMLPAIVGVLTLCVSGCSHSDGRAKTEAASELEQLAKRIEAVSATMDEQNRQLDHLRAVVTARNATGNTGSVSQRLQKKITMTFPRNTLEMALQMLGNDTGVPITIIGHDLQMEGITKNQSFAFDERDQPAYVLLGKMMQICDPGGKLICVVRQGAVGEELFLTTRVAARQRGETGFYCCSP
jgi:hypothetical protein